MNYINKYNDKTDEELVSIIQSGDNSALDILMQRYDEVVRKKCKRFFMTGADSNDIYQEGMIGLYFAIRDYDPNNTAAFKSFANLCVERQLISAIKSANRQKHYLLNNAISLNASIDDEDNNSNDVMYFLKDSAIEDPLDIIANSEYYKLVENSILDKLSSHERQVLDEFRKGKSYVEIAQKLDCKTKSVDTALTRIRRKAAKIQNDINRTCL